ncbi:MAG: FCD domain-containing protein, partial [Rhodobacteraceae bacterium]|nr:FCD domain-containing protein [Paracoccaceae bacterium]
FHRLAISIAENTLGLSIWEGISRQVMIIFGFEIHQKPELDLAAVVEQHQRLRRFLAEGDPSELEAVMREHITGQKPCAGLPSEQAHPTK